jgi:Flp pilus assembly protein TadG
MLRDIRGSVYIESVLVIPMFLALVLGTIDATYMFYQWALANKAAYVGARTAVVSNPVASAITNLTYSTNRNFGLPCYGTSNCPTVSTVCASGSCTNGGNYDSAAFSTILTAMQRVFCPAAAAANCSLKAQNVTISYQSNGSGTAGQTYDGNTNHFNIPMNVTVSITGMTTNLYFTGGLVALLSIFTGGGVAFSTTPAIPTFATTMQSESLYTD